MVGRAGAAQVAEAAEALRASLQAALACVTTAQLLGRAPYAFGDDSSLDLSENPAILGRDRTVALRVAHRYRVARDADGTGSELRTVSYSYWLFDRDGHELLLYQWVPDGPSPVKTPHLHVGALKHPSLPAAVRRQFEALVKAHLPTGHVTLAALLRVVIDDLGVEPLESDRQKLADRLNAAEAVLRASFGWAVGSADA